MDGGATESNSGAKDVDSEPDRGGEVLNSYGFDSKQQVDELMRISVGDKEDRQWRTQQGVRTTER